ncbi:MAG: pilus assembly protein TadG-related protein [Candidatus Sulfotelmatobacter sp.]|jgi:Flp pilus assembly protein TadG
MKKPLIRRSQRDTIHRKREHGVTMVLVAISMVAIISIAALSIDVITLYLAREEAQRSADSAALAAAKIISVSGLTGDPTNSAGNWQKICGPDNGVNGLATRVAKSVAGQDTVGGIVATSINVGYSAGSGGTMGAGTSDCSTLTGTAFGVNPIVTVQLTRASLPTFFSRIWGNTGAQVSATATAEAYNPSNSANSGNQTSGTMIPVQPRCIKPWAVPNQDPQNPASCTPTGATACKPLINVTDGSIMNPGMTLNGSTGPGTVGETFWLDPDCRNGNRANCQLHGGGAPVQPEANYPTGAHGTPNLLYVPAQVGTPVLAVPSCTSGEQYEEAIEGCDQPTNYACGMPGNVNVIDTTINPVAGTTAGVSCLINQSDTADFTNASGQDYLTTSGTFGAPNAYPYQMMAGSANPTGLKDVPISISSSIVSLPIYDNNNGPGKTLASNTQNPVTFVGFLQVFINAVDQNGSMKVTVLNVAGCGNGSAGAPATSEIGNSPVPVRLITPP